MVRSKVEAAVQQQIVFLRLTQRKPGAQRTKRRMIYGLLAKQTPTEAREHPQLPHWDASWAHLQRILGASSANLVDCDVDIRIGSGFLNHINGYISKSSDCIVFSAKEYSEADGDGAENTEWKRT